MKQKLAPYLLIGPVVVFVAAMVIVPVGQVLTFSFSEVKLPLLQPSWVGLRNYVDLIEPDTLRLAGRTVAWVVGSAALRFALGFGAALVFNQRFPGSLAMRILAFIPWAVPSVVGANLWRWILQTDNGVVNQTLRSLGLDALALNWLGDPATAMIGVMVAYAWTGFPFVMLLVLAGLRGVPVELVDAAKVDGAGTWRAFVNITLPAISPILVVVIVLEIVSGINSFDFLMIMTGGGPADATQIWGLEIYREAFTFRDFGSASALSVVLLGAAAVFVGIYLRLQRTNATPSPGGGRRGRR